LGICQQKQLKLIVLDSAAQRKILEFADTKQLKLSALYFALPRSKNILEFASKTSQVDCISFCRAAKKFGIYQPKQLKSECIFSAGQRNFFELQTK
jgi:hypothetical protein